MKEMNYVLIILILLNQIIKKKIIKFVIFLNLKYY
jgi:hypothetical protein